MKRDLDDQLCRKYPSLYRDRHGDPKSTAMCWGFDCGNGWFQVIDVLSELLSKHSADVYAGQVKEKFGSLHFYYSGGNKYTDGLVSSAQSLSSMLCEICGSQALIKTKFTGWFTTRCKEHTKDYCDKEYVELDFSRVAYLGFGKAWSALMLILMDSCDWRTEHNDMPATHLSITKEAGKLIVSHAGGDDFTCGMIDFIVRYANVTDENTGQFTEDNR